MNQDLMKPFRWVYRELLLAYAPALIGVFALSLIAYGFLMYNHTMVVDDWTAFQVERFQYPLAVQFGRWMQVVAWMLFYDNTLAPAFSLMFMLACWWGASLLLLRALGVTSNLNAFIFLAVFSFCPFWVDMALFRNNHATAGLGVFFAMASGLLAWHAMERVFSRGLGPWMGIQGLSAAVLFSLAAATFQVLALIAPMTVIVLWLGRLLDAPRVETRLSRFAGRAAMLFAIFIAGLAIYGVEVYVTRGLMGVGAPDSPGYQMVGSLVASPAELAAALRGLMTQLSAFLFTETHAFPGIGKVLMWIGLLSLVGVAVMPPQRGLTSGVSFALAFSLLVVALVLAPWTLAIIREVDPGTYKFNALVQIAMALAGVFLIAIRGQRYRLPRSVVQLSAIGLIAVFVFQQNAASLVTNTIMRRDLAVAERVVQRIETAPDFMEISENGTGKLWVVPVGRLKPPAGKGFRLADVKGPFSTSFVHCGVFSCDIRAVGAALHTVQSAHVSYYTALLDTERLAPEREAAAREVLRDMEPWPSEGAVRVLPEKVVVIYLGEEPGARE